jgi:hypothetical protein
VAGFVVGWKKLKDLVLVNEKGNCPHSFRSAFELTEVLFQFAVLRLIPALDLIFELMVIEAVLWSLKDDNGSECNRLHKVCQWLNLELIEERLEV